MFQAKLVEPGALLPIRATPNSAGLYLFASEEAIIQPNNRKLISTGLSICLPDCSYGRIAPRSGLSLKALDVGGGVIDADYRGIVKIILINNSNEKYVVNYGDKIAQLIIEKIYMIEPIIVTEVNETARNDKGFGSSGI